NLNFSRLLIPVPSTLFPYTTLFRSHSSQLGRAVHRAPASRPPDRPVPSGGRSESRRAWSEAGGDAGCRTEHRGTSGAAPEPVPPDRKSTRLNSSHVKISYAVFCLKK